MRLAVLSIFTLLAAGPLVAAALDEKPPPLTLERGKAVLQPGARLFVPMGTLVESAGKPLTALAVTRLWVVPPKQERWVYEIRPLGSEILSITVGKEAFKGLALLRPAIAYEDGTEPDGFLANHHSLNADAGVAWLEQPYEIRDRSGAVLYSERPQPRAEPAVPAPKSKQDLRSITLQSGVLSNRLPLPENVLGVNSVTLTADVDGAGEGHGRLVLAAHTVEYNDIGDQLDVPKIAGVGLKCSLKFLKMSKVKINITPGLDQEVEWRLYEIRGKKITSRLQFAAPTTDLESGRLLILNDTGKVVSVIALHAPPHSHIGLNPCHPGCFPAGTPIVTPQGDRPIEKIKVGDIVTSISPDGASVPVKVQSIFVTCNQLLRVETEAGVLITTPTQPLCVEGGAIRATEQLKPGDRIIRWNNGKRQSTTVLRVTDTKGHDQVFNLVLGNSEVFVAGGFLARSKPPVIAAQATLQPSGFASNRNE